MKRFSTFFWAASFVILAGTGCQTKPADLPEGANAYKAEEPAAATTTVQWISRLAKERVTMESLEADKNGNLPITFRLMDASGKELASADLKDVQGKKVHALLVRNDLRFLQHLYPAYGKDGWGATAKVGQPGPYQLFLDIAPVNEDALVLRVSLQLGEGKVSRLPDAALAFAAESPPYRAELTLSDAPRAGKSFTLSYHLTRDGKPHADLKPILGAYGYAIALGHKSPDHFVRTVPITTKKPADGVVAFAIAFPTPGRYTILAEFDVGVGARVFPITVDILP